MSYRPAHEPLRRRVALALAAARLVAAPELARRGCAPRGLGLCVLDPGCPPALPSGGADPSLLACGELADVLDDGGAPRVPVGPDRVVRRGADGVHGGQRDSPSAARAGLARGRLPRRR